MRGFSLLEILIALLVLTAGLLAAGDVLFIAASSGSLARSKGTAALAAQDLLESLEALYQQNPLAADLAMGTHGPRELQVVNPVDSGVLNGYGVTWEVKQVPDLRPGKTLDAKIVSVTVLPVMEGGAGNSKTRMNKILNVSTILSPRGQ